MFTWQLAIYLLALACSISLMIFGIIVLLQNVFGIPPYMPSFNRKIKEVLTEVQARHKGKSKLKFIDLGSGDGKITFLAAKLGYDAFGIEINPFLVAWSKLRAMTWRAPNRPQFRFGSYFNHDLSQYDIIFTYLFPETMAQLEEKIFTELKPGTIVVSNTFKFAKHKPVSEDKHVLVYKNSR